MKTSLLRTVAVLAVASASVAACGSSKTTTTSPATSSGASSSSSAPGPTGSPITVMSIYPDNSAGENFPEVATTAKAYAKYINAHGGIGGHPLNVLTCNDQNNPNTGATCARTAVSEHAVAVVGAFSFTDGAVLPVLEAAGIPMVGNTAASALDLSSAWSFPLQAGPIGFVALGALAAKNCSTIDELEPDIATIAALAPFLNAGLASGGKKLNKTVKIPLSATDLSSVAQATKGADCVTANLAEPVLQQYLAAAQAQGIKPKVIGIAGGVTTALLKSAGSQLESGLLISAFAAPSDPGWNTFNQAIADYNGPKFDLASQEAENTWLSYVIFNQIAAKLPSITGPTLKTALSASTSVETGGLSAPINFSKTFPVPGLPRIFNTSLTTFALTGGKFVQQGGFTDYSQDLLSAAKG